MKIAMFFYDIYRVAGIQRVICRMANGLVERGHEVTIFVGDDSEKTQFELSGLITVKSLGVPEYTSEKFRYFGKIIWAVVAYFKFKKVVDSESFDVIVDHGTSLGLIMPMLSVGSVPVVLFRHFPVANFPGGAFLYRTLCYLIARRPIVVLTERIAKDLIALGYSDVKVIPNFHELREDGEVISRRERKKIFLALGRDNPQKGFDILIEAFSKAKIPDWHLKIMGPGVDVNGELIDARRRFSLENSIELCSATNFVADEIDNAEVFVLSSRYEGFPMVLLEALDRNACILTTNVSGVEECVVHGVSAIVCEPSDVDSMVNALRLVSSDSIMRNSLRHGTIGISNRYSKSRVLNKWEAYLGEVADRFVVKSRHKRSR